MKRIKRVFGWAGAGGIAAVLVAGPAAAAKPLPGNDNLPARVVFQEAPKSVDDTRNEILQIVTAGFVGASLTGVAFRIRQRKPARLAT